MYYLCSILFHHRQTPILEEFPPKDPYSRHLRIDLHHHLTAHLHLEHQPDHHSTENSYYQKHYHSDYLMRLSHSHLTMDSLYLRHSLFLSYSDSLFPMHKILYLLMPALR